MIPAIPQMVSSSACFAKKGAKVAMSRFFGAFYRFRHEEDQQWHIRLMGLLYWGITTGMFGKAKMDKLFQSKVNIRVNTREAACSIAVGDQQLKELRSLCENGLHLASVMYSDDSNLRRWRVVDLITALGVHLGTQRARVLSSHGGGNALCVCVCFRRGWELVSTALRCHACRASRLWSGRMLG